MKKLFICPSLLLVSMMTYSQIFEIAELEKLCNLGNYTFETEVVKKGYSYWSLFSEDHTKMYRSEYVRTNGTSDQISLTLYPGETPTVQYATTDGHYRSSFDNMLSDAGYTYLNTRKQIVLGEETDWTYFSNQSYIITVYTLPANNIVWYNFQIFKI